MICPICNSVSENNKKCSNCGEDLSLFSKVSKISDALYNKGISLAKANDFTHAEEVLSKSILFNKNNINSRNLLGLVYYETGRLSLALKEWIISSNIKKDGNLAVEYVDYFQKNTAEISKIEESIKLYNQALKFASQKSEDMAIIQLKKVIDYNPKFVKALNLLSLCYMMQGQNDKALEIIRNVLIIDTSNPEALTYFKELCPDGTRLVESIKIVKTNKAYDEPVRFEPKISRKERDFKISRMMELLLFLAGCICTAAVMFILVIPDISTEKQDEIDKLNTEMIALQNKYDQEKSKNVDEKLTKLTEENETLKLEITKYQKLNDERNANDQVTSASAIAIKDNSKAAEIISGINSSILTPEKLKEFEKLKKKVYDKEAKALLNKGIKAVNTKKYQEAKELLEKSILYSDTDQTVKFNAMYYLASAVKELGDATKAKEYFSQVAQNHPQNRYKKLATKELEKL